jgi:hypothetical protein
MWAGLYCSLQWLVYLRKLICLYRRQDWVVNYSTYAFTRLRTVVMMLRITGLEILLASIGISTMTYTI